MILQTQLDSAIQKEKNCFQNMVSKEAYEELVRKSGNCQDDLTQALEKVRPRKVRPRPLSAKEVVKETRGGGATSGQESRSCMTDTLQCFLTLARTGRSVQRRPAFS